MVTATRTSQFLLQQTALHRDRQAVHLTKLLPFTSTKPFRKLQTHVLVPKTMLSPGLKPTHPTVSIWLQNMPSSERSMSKLLPRPQL